MSRRVLNAALVGLLLLCPHAVLAQGSSGTLADARGALDRLDLGHARAVLDARADDRSPQALQLRALLEFHEGNYTEAAEHMQALARSQSTLPPHVRELKSWIDSAASLRARMEHAQTGGGRYQAWFEPRDRLLAVYALEALEAADKSLTALFGKAIRGPIRLEIYPGPSSLAQVSSLTVEHIETTGTVALSKWNRLMVTSPRALLRGYPWLDTICHELVHMVLAELSANKAPVWVHEGLAKLLERTWRGESPMPPLSPASHVALVKAAKNGGLIPFDKLHPSIAMLPSQDDAALAFAQVATFMQILFERGGAGAIKQLTDLMAQGRDARKAVGEVWGDGFADLEATWKRAQASKPVPKEAPSLIKLRFRSDEEDHHDESLDIAEKRARRHVRLGDMLWTRGRKKAASREYERAHRYAPEDAILASRLGRTAVEAGEPKRALKPLKLAIERQPGYAPLRALLGEASLLVGDAGVAREELREAIRLNPFDPTPHCGLAKLPGTRTWEQAVCEHLRDGKGLMLPEGLNP